MCRAQLRRFLGNLLQARKEAKLQEEKPRPLQAERLKLDAGEGGSPGIDELDRLVADGSGALAGSVNGSAQLVAAGGRLWNSTGSGARSGAGRSR